MRNDARPIGEDSPASPVGGHEDDATVPRRDAAHAAPDARDSVAHDRQSVVVNRGAEGPEAEGPEDTEAEVTEDGGGNG
jgi:hypothetical protein